MKAWSIAAGILLAALHAFAQDDSAAKTDAGYVPTLSGGFGYVHHVEGGVTTLEPQINPVLLVPLGPHVLLESRAEFTGFFTRQFQTSGPFTGKVFKSVDYAQLDWLANTHLIATAGRYISPFGLYGERLSPVWIRNLQDVPITFPIGTRTSGAGDGIMLRGVLRQTPSYSAQYTSYFSVRSEINELQAGRAGGGDVSIYLPTARLEIGGSYQRLLQQRNINSIAAYLSWQPSAAPLDLKLELDRSYNGQGYWVEGAYLLSQIPAATSFFKRVQLVPRLQRFHPLHGGGNSLPRVDTRRFDFGLNYYLRDDLRFVSSYGRQFSSQLNSNIWNTGLTYRFAWPLWPARKQ